MTKKIGIFSGSFDPVHKGHIAFAQKTAKICNLDTVVFLPERFPRDKPNITPVSERITELEIALRKLPFAVLELPMDRFTVTDTLPELKLFYPDDSFVFLVGSDVALNLAQWKNIDRLVKHYSFAVGMRTGDSPAAVQQAMAALGAQYTLVTTSYSSLSSSNLK